MLEYLLYMNIGNPAFDYSNKHVFAMKSGSQLPFCNRVYGTDSTDTSDILKLKIFYATVPFRWFVHNQDKAMINLLQVSGFQYKISYPAMIKSLENLNEQDYGSGVRVEKINNQDLTAWIKLVCKAYSIPAIEQFRIFVDYLIARAGSEKVHCYIGYYQGIPAAASMIIDHTDSVGLHWVATIPEYRSKGLGHAVSHKPLLDAQQRGFKQAILLASEMGKPRYVKLGFKEYATYDVYGY